MAEGEYIMVRLRRETHVRLRELQSRLGTTEGKHGYYLKDWKGDLVFSLDSVVNILLDRDDDHRARSNRKSAKDASGRDASGSGPRIGH